MVYVLKQIVSLFVQRKNQRKGAENDNRGLSLRLPSLCASAPLQAPVRTVFGFALTPMMFLALAITYSVTTNKKIRIILSDRKSGKGANCALFFGAVNGHEQMAKNRGSCLFRPLFLWFISFGGSKEMNIKDLIQNKERTKSGRCSET